MTYLYESHFQRWKTLTRSEKEDVWGSFWSEAYLFAKGLCRQLCRNADNEEDCASSVITTVLGEIRRNAPQPDAVDSFPGYVLARVVYRTRTHCDRMRVEQRRWVSIHEPIAPDDHSLTFEDVIQDPSPSPEEQMRLAELEKELRARLRVVLKKAAANKVVAIERLTQFQADCKNRNRRVLADVLRCFVEYAGSRKSRYFISSKDVSVMSFDELLDLIGKTDAYDDARRKLGLKHDDKEEDDRGRAVFDTRVKDIRKIITKIA